MENMLGQCLLYITLLALLAWPLDEKHIKNCRSTARLSRSLLLFFGALLAQHAKRPRFLAAF